MNKQPKVQQREEEVMDERRAKSFSIPLIEEPEDELRLYCEKIDIKEGDVLVMYAPLSVDEVTFGRILAYARDTLKIRVLALYEGIDCHLFRK